MFIAVLAALSLSSPSHAQITVDARAHTCQELKQIVKQQKVVLLVSGHYGGRFVASKYDCPPSDRIVGNAFLRSMDTRFCNPGLLCRVKFPGE